MKIHLAFYKTVKVIAVKQKHFPLHHMYDLYVCLYIYNSAGEKTSPSFSTKLQQYQLGQFRCTRRVFKYF